MQSAAASPFSDQAARDRTCLSHDAAQLIRGHPGIRTNASHGNAHDEADDEELLLTDARLSAALSDSRLVRDFIRCGCRICNTRSPTTPNEDLRLADFILGRDHEADRKAFATFALAGCLFAIRAYIKNASYLKEAGLESFLNRLSRDRNAQTNLFWPFLERRIPVTSQNADDETLRLDELTRKFAASIRAKRRLVILPRFEKHDDIEILEPCRLPFVTQEQLTPRGTRSSRLTRKFYKIRIDPDHCTGETLEVSSHSMGITETTLTTDRAETYS